MRRRHLQPSGAGLRDAIPIRLTDDQFEARFGSEEQCRDFLYRFRWPGGFVCSCSSRQFVWVTSKRLRCTACRQAHSLTSGTILHGTRKDLRLWFRAAFLVGQRGCNARLLGETLGLTYKVAWTWCHKLRAVMSAPKTTLDAPFPPFEQSPDARGGRTSALARRRWFASHGHFEWRADRPGGLGECCERLTRIDWDLPSRELEPERYARESSSVFLSVAKEHLFAASSGSVGEKHLGAYLAETEFRLNHRLREPSETAGILAERFMSTGPLPYFEIVGPREERPALRLWSPPLSNVPLVPSDEELARAPRAI